MSRVRNLGLFLLVTVLFGAVFPVIKVGLVDVPPPVRRRAILPLGGVAAGVRALCDRPVATPHPGDRTAVLAGGTLFIGGTGLSFVGLQFTTSGVGAIVFSLIPILTVLAAWVLLPEERPDRRGLLGVVVGFLGVAIVVRPDPAALGTSVVGELLVLSSAAGVALGTVLVRRSRPTMSVVALTGWAMAVGATVQLGFALALGESLAAVRPTLSALVALVYLAVVGGAVGFVIYFTLLERLGPLEINLIAYLVPVVTVAIGWAFLDEPVVPAMVAGFLVVLVGFGLLTDHEIAAELARLRGAGR
ncbi:DMT family transporter [Halalkalicoccus salilacus]|uniref:DMT family transporter n=1 Tax=Halalkalicoccus sp. GCM10025704 TaxID=3252662 RepID=UPI0036225E71